MVTRPLKRAAAGAGAGIDRLIVRAAFRSRRASKKATNDAREGFGERLAEATGFYAAADRDGQLFGEPEAIGRLVKEKFVRPISRGEVVDLRWPSGYAARYAGHQGYLDGERKNQNAHARWWRHHRKRPALICVHGWGAGQYPLEELAFRAQYFFRKGLDVVFFTLPFHARRGRRGIKMPDFPSTDPFRTNEGFAQAIHDLRGLIRFLRERGAPSVGVSGMSLGGFTTSLLCTVGEPIEFAVPIIPVASIPDIMWRHGENTAAQKRAADAGIDKARFAAAFAATTPVARTPTLAPERIMVIAGERDELVPADHPPWLRDHFGTDHYVTFAGSHLVHVGKGRAFRRMMGFIEDLGAV